MIGVEKAQTISLNCSPYHILERSLKYRKCNLLTADDGEFSGPKPDLGCPTQRGFPKTAGIQSQRRVFGENLSFGRPGQAVACAAGDLDQGLEFYRLAQDIIKNGTSRIYGKRGRNMRYPQGTQLVLRRWANQILAVLHSFEKPEKNVRISLPFPAHIRAQFCNSAIRVAGSTLLVNIEEEFMGCAVILEKIDLNTELPPGSDTRMTAREKASK